MTCLAQIEHPVSLWYLRSVSELQQDGDTGGTVASASSSNRYGVERANYYTPSEHLAIDFDFADSKPSSPKLTRMMLRRVARAASMYPKRSGW